MHVVYWRDRSQTIIEHAKIKMSPWGSIINKPTQFKVSEMNGLPRHYWTPEGAKKQQGFSGLQRKLQSTTGKPHIYANSDFQVNLLNGVYTHKLIDQPDARESRGVCSGFAKAQWLDCDTIYVSIKYEANIKSCKMCRNWANSCTVGDGVDWAYNV